MGRRSHGVVADGPRAHGAGRSGVAGVAGAPDAVFQDLGGAEVPAARTPRDGAEGAAFQPAGAALSSRRCSPAGGGSRGYEDGERILAGNHEVGYTVRREIGRAHV